MKRDPGLALAFERGGGIRPTARRMAAPPSRLAQWKQCPRDQLFDLAAASGVDPEDIRPDLTAWIAAERERRWLARARERFAVRSGMGEGTATVRSHERADPQTLDLLDLGLIVAAVRFVAGERGLTVSAVMAAPKGGGGRPTPEQGARSLASALAVVVGRVNSETVAGLFGVTRQNVDAAAERFLRARDGDFEPGDEEAASHVLERGHVRLAKAADPALWGLQRRFAAALAGEGGR